MKNLRLIFALLVCLAATAHAAETPRQIIAKALITEDAAEQGKLINSLVGIHDDSIRVLLDTWKEGGIYLYEAPEGLPGFAAGAKIPLIPSGDKDADEKQSAVRVDNGEPLKDAQGKAVRLATGDIESADTSSELREAMKNVLDLFALAAPDPKDRLNVINEIGLAQDAAHLPTLQAREKLENDPKVKRAIHEAIALIHLKSEDAKMQIAAVQELQAMSSLPSLDALGQLVKDSSAPEKKEVAKAAAAAIASLQAHTKVVNFFGTIFRGFSLGSILLVVAIGLAITFGLMGVINMAHGELIVVGAYTTYVVQCIFGTGLELSPFGIHFEIHGMKTTGLVYDSYFILALPLSFLMAALVGIALERGIIRFLYRRPLESLLATWGVSLVLQQLFRRIFGANNVQVDSPAWLSGNWTVFDVILGWNRVFVIGFAVLIIIGTWMLLTKTPLGLLIRAVMQNRSMAACMGVRTERVNMLTFGFGSGLAGLAGAFLSQIGNVGPSLGQSYIVDAFMTVVVGGVGNIFGTVISALGIGVVDQSLQQILLNPVLGKILVLAMIILFLQWKPAGLFVTKSRSLES